MSNAWVGWCSSILGACSFQSGALHDAAITDDDASDARAIDASSDGASTPALSTRGLLARYFLDEAANGTTPTMVLDSAPNPANLPLTYTPELAYTDTATGRGLRWTTQGTAGRASLATASSKFTALNGATTWSYEIVVDVRNQGSQSRIVSVNDNTNGYGTASMLTGGSTDLRLFAGAELAAWSGVDLAAGRVVLHAVVDSTRSTDRAQLYINGTPRTLTSDFASSTAIVLGANDFFTLGNVEGSSRSFEGDLFYVAMYTVTLTPAEIAANSALLLANDDRP